MDDHHGLLATEQRGDALLQIIQRIAMLGEDDQLLMRGGCGRRYRAGTIRSDGLGDLVRDRRGREDGSEQARQFAPLGIGSAATNRLGVAFQALQGFDLDAQLSDGACGGRLVEDLLLSDFDFVVGCFLKVLNVFAVEGGGGSSDDRRLLSSAL